MSVKVSIGPFQTSARMILRGLTLPFRYLAWTPSLEHRLDRLERQVQALTEVMIMILAHLSGEWTDEQRERVLRHVANFNMVSRGVAESTNPLSQEERARLQQYVHKLEAREGLMPGEAADFRYLAEKEADAHPKDDWAADLLKLGLVAFALYALSEIFKPKEDS